MIMPPEPSHNPRVSSWRISVFVRLVLLLLVFLIAACGSKEPQSNALCINIYSEPPSLDPRKACDCTSANVLVLLFEGLFRIDEEGEVVPAVARDVEISSDGLEYTFHLRKCFWSNGEQLTAHHFLFTWQQILDPLFPGANSYKLYPIKNALQIKKGLLPMTALGVFVLDETTLKIELEHPTPYLLELLSGPSFFPIYPTTIETWASEAGDTYVCNGPFMMERWEHNSRIRVVRNPHYWDQQKIRLDALELTMIEDTTTELHLFEQGMLDWAGSPLSNLPIDALPYLDNRGKIETAPFSAVYYYMFNTSIPHLSNSNIRKALAYAIDRNEIVQYILSGAPVPAQGLSPPHCHPGENLTFFPAFDKEEAKSLFERGCKELGVTPKEFPPITLTYNTNRQHQSIALAIQQKWQEILGIQVSLESTDWKSFLGRVDRRDFEICRMGWVGDFNDPAAFLLPFKYADAKFAGSGNHTGWENELFTSLLDQAQNELDPDKRKELLLEAEEIIMEEMPVIPIHFPVSQYVRNSAIQDISVTPFGTLDFRKASR